MDFGPSPTKRRILVIDDDPVSLAISVVLAESEGWLVLQASCGQQALDILGQTPESAHPHCILADLRMPNLSGPDLALRLREAAPRACILAMTATPPPSVRGYDGILSKPLRPEVLRAVLVPQEPADDILSRTDDVEAVLDLDVFDRLRRVMNAAALEEVVTTFIHDAASRIAIMRQADQAVVRREAHIIKGGASMIGALQVAVVASAIESGIDHDGEGFCKLDELEAQCRRAEVILLQRLRV